MKPVVIDGWCTLYHAENAEIIDVLREHAPDAVITDPPYGLNLKGAGMGSKNALTRRANFPPRGSYPWG